MLRRNHDLSSSAELDFGIEWLWFPGCFPVLQEAWCVAVEMSLPANSLHVPVSLSKTCTCWSVLRILLYFVLFFCDWKGPLSKNEFGIFSWKPSLSHVFWVHHPNSCISSSPLLEFVNPLVRSYHPLCTIQLQCIKVGTAPSHSNTFPPFTLADITNWSWHSFPLTPSKAISNGSSMLQMLIIYQVLC